MRIQHNIMAMNAYRNYTNNTSALAKNLEKLSSGYRINRAGDDAAGLAISEKMRAQITALGTAQKNVKDGISLVKTAEGATQEIHDMLNRMVSLAEQSANGTYQDEVDREAIVDEFNALKDEINRITKASNFNGIKLLDGSLDAGGDTTITKGAFQFAANHGGAVDTGSVALPAVGTTLGADTVLHAGATAGSKTNEFSVELHNLEFSNATGSSLSVKIGADEFTFDAGAGTVAADTKMTASDIATAFATGKFEDAAGAMTAGKATIDGVEYTVEAKGNKLVFTTEEDVASIPATVEITGDDGNGAVTGTDAPAKLESTVTITDAGGAYTANNNAKIQFTGTGLDVSFKYSTGTNSWAVDGAPTLTGYTATFDGSKLTITADDDGPVGAASPFGTITATLTDAAATGPLVATPDAGTWTDGTSATKGAGESAIKGDYNVSTTDITAKAAAADARLASTHFTLTDDMVKDGSSITIGTKTYTFTTDAKNIGKAGYVDATSGDLAKIAENLTDAVAKDNTTYTLGTDATAGHITITEIDGQTDFDLTTMDGIEKSLGFATAVTSASTPDNALTLQIGDTSDSYNQLSVSIKAMNTASLGLDSLDLGSQKGAAAAVSVIKDAINSVSSTRGKLGALQNRLEHTGNNLSTMKENIQDAEATIRDTDIAEEMMAYTKNNILVQSAQAMLAQANQIPQGVLQLLG